jgi:hypothetical protein
MRRQDMHVAYATWAYPDRSGLVRAAFPDPSPAGTSRRTGSVGALTDRTRERPPRGSSRMCAMVAGLADYYVVCPVEQMRC